MVTRAPRKSVAELNEAIFSAVIHLLETSGYENVTFNNVAKASGVGRPVLYRRFADPFTMVLAAEQYYSVDEVQSYDQIDFSGKRLRENLIDSLMHFNGSPPFMRAFLIELGRGTETVNNFFAELSKQNELIMTRMLEQAILDGELKNDVIREVKLMPFRALLYQVLVDQSAVSLEFVTDLVDNIVIPAIHNQQK
ncbi:TetR/AcrR family transcriptional regulator [Weissella muntiaci]|uniref:TetR/AcrR family transcriptional regulator n=1 Tax=Weissella muntiaci TaxID=2508881 RepID=A0A6C2C357_9LACO|nr:TetR/AcrR family transcriptional regulator [Weissella muntiaci]TYC48159.1 TetR/AcrR family transcriptional regulator [Weissella muntiaci]